VNWDRYNELVALRSEGRIEESMAGLAELFEQDEDRLNKALVLIEIAEGLRQLGHSADARRKLNEATALLGQSHEYYPRAAFQLALLDMVEGDWKGMLKRLDDLLKSHTPTLKMEDHRDLLEEVQRRRGMALAKLGRFAEARPLLESARSNTYDRVATLAYLGACDYELKDFDGAMEVYNELLSTESSPDDSIFRAQAHYHRAIIFWRRGQAARAKFELEQCLACPNRGEIRDDNLLGWLIDVCKELMLVEEVTRYAELLKERKTQ